MSARTLTRSRSATLIALTLTVAACDVGEAKLDGDLLAAPSAPLPVETVPVAIGDLYARYHATSNVTAKGEAQVIARVDGQVIETLVEEGDPVTQGQILARIDGERLRLRLLQTAAELTQRESEYRRQHALHQRGLVSRAGFESLKFEIDELRAAVGIDRLTYGYTEIRAPISGVVSARHIRPGQHVKSGDLAFRITDMSQLIAELHIPQRELAHFESGLGVTLAVDAFPDSRFAAEIERISPTIDAATGAIRATVRIDNRGGKLTPGMFGRFEIRFAKHEQALSLPADCILEEDGASVVYRLVDGRAQRQVITTGIHAGEHMEVLSGLSVGDEVIVSGGGLRDGSRVIAATGHGSSKSG